MSDAQFLRVRAKTNETKSSMKAYPNAVQDRLGYASTEITLDIYFLNFATALTFSSVRVRTALSASATHHMSQRGNAMTVVMNVRVVNGVGQSLVSVQEKVPMTKSQKTKTIATN